MWGASHNKVSWGHNFTFVEAFGEASWGGDGDDQDEYSDCGSDEEEDSGEEEDSVEEGSDMEEDD